MELDFSQWSAEVGVHESLLAATGAVPQSNAWHEEASSEVEALVVLSCPHQSR